MTNKKIITGGQFFLLVFISRLSLIMLYSSNTSGINNLWNFLIPVTALTPILLFFCLPLIHLLNRRQLSIIERPILGSSLRKTTGTLYACYYLLSAVYGIIIMLSFMGHVIPEGIDPKLIIIFIVIGCVYSSSKGIEPSARMSAVVMVLITVTIVLSIWFLAPLYSSVNLSPLSMASINGITDGFVFLLSRINSLSSVYILNPSVKGNIKKGFIGYVVFSCLFLVFMLVFFTGSTGDVCRYYLLQVYHSIEGSAAMQRLDPIVILVIVCSFFCHISLLLTAFSESLKAAFPEIRNRRLWLTTAAFLPGTVILCRRIMSDNYFDRYIWMIINVLFCVIIPSIILYSESIFIEKRKPGSVIRSASVVLSVIILIGIISGCQSVQLNQRIIVQGIGIDRSEDNYLLTFITLDTDNHDDTNSSVLLYSNGKNPEEAIDALEQQKGKRILLSQCLFLLMDNNASENCSQTLDYFCKRRDIQTGINLIASDDSSRRCLEKAVEEYHLSAEAISMIFDSKAIEHNNAHLSLADYLAEAQQENYSIMIPGLCINDELHTLETDGSFVLQDNNFYRLDQKNTNWVLFLKKRSGLFKAETKTLKHQKMRFDSIILPLLENNKLKLKIEIHLKTEDILTKQYKALLQQEIKNDLSECLHLILNKKGSDLLMLKRMLLNAYPQEKAVIHEFHSLLINSETELIVIAT